MRNPVLIWLAAAAIGALVLAAADWTDQRLWTRLATHGLPVEATVARVEPNNHGAVLYTYTVDGKNYSSGSIDWLPHLDINKLHPGDVVPVVYDRQHPATSCLCDLSSLRRAWWRYLSDGLLWTIPILLAFAIRILFRKAQSTRSLRQRARLPEPREPTAKTAHRKH
jgi:hypothetical protein